MPNLDTQECYVKKAFEGLPALPTHWALYFI